MIHTLPGSVFTHSRTPESLVHLISFTWSTSTGTFSHQHIRHSRASPYLLLLLESLENSPKHVRGPHGVGDCRCDRRKGMDSVKKLKSESNLSSRSLHLIHSRPIPHSPSTKWSTTLSVPTSWSRYVVSLLAHLTGDLIVLAASSSHL